jgi:hypothetical protein
MLLGISLLVALLFLIAGTHAFSRYEFPAFVNSLRIGRLHYLLIGIGLGICLPADADLLSLFGKLRTSLVGVALVWFGLCAGLSFDFRTIRKHPPIDVISALTRAGCTFVLVVLGVLASASLFRSHLGVPDGILPMGVLLAALSTTFRFPEPVLRLQGRPSPPTLCTNPVAIVLFGVLFPMVSPDAVIQLGPFTSVGYTGTLAILLGLGLLLGIALDFVFHAHKDPSRCIILLAGLVAAIGGPCLHLQIPAVFVGGVGGAWLINTSIRRREVLEMADRAGYVVEPVFYALVGTWIGDGQLLPDPLVVGLLGLALFLGRGVARILAAALASRALHQRMPGTVLLIAGTRPLGAVSAALIVQVLYLPVQTDPAVFVPGALLALFLSQALFVQPPAETR